MRTNVLLKSLRFALLVAVCGSAFSLFAQNSRPSPRPTQPEQTTSSERVTQAPDRQHCIEETDRLFGLTLQRLRATNPNLDVPAILRGLRTSVHYGTPADFDIAVLTRDSRTAVIASFSCPVDATDFQGSFRIFAIRDGQYSIIARSEDYPVLSQADVDGFPISTGLITVHPVSHAAAQLITQWTRGGGAPPTFSLVVWDWDGQKLEPIWSRVDIKESSVEFIGPLLLIEALGPDQRDENAWQAYRVNDGQVSFDGTLDKYSLDRYLSTKMLQPETPDEFRELGELWQIFGEQQTALASYKQALATDTTRNSDYLYYNVADLYDKLGEPAAAIEALNQYRTRNVNELTPEARRDIEQHIQALRRKVASQQ
jgi:hypothetical protein